MKLVVDTNLPVVANRRKSEHASSSGADDGNDFAEFPQDRELVNFDRADRKFVALALTHPEKPAILNATDTDWWHHLAILKKHGVPIRLLCPDAMP